MSAMINNTFIFVLATGILSSGMILPVAAQVTSDGTTNTTVNSVGNNFNIINGIDKGNNLFHSFSNFSISTGGSATFDLVNTPNINTIFSRVTGGNISNIDGLIRTVNSSNPVSLFLMNPNGIMFGQNAKLDIGGSFYGTTAQNIVFLDGFKFSAIDVSNTPLLTMSVPIGLQMGSNPGNITVKGSGHNIITRDVTFAPYINPGNFNSLSVKPGNTLGLISGNITLDGGILNTESGRIELASVTEGTVNLNQTAQNLQLDITPNSKLGDIKLSQKSLLDVSGIGAGSIVVNGNSVSLQDGSLLFVQNRGLQPAGDIKVNATQSLDINGMSPDGRIRSVIINETLAGSSGNIYVTTPKLTIKNGGAIGSRTFSPAPGGNVYLDVPESIEVSGVSVINPLIASAIASISLGSGKAGDIIASTKKFSLSDSATISGVAFGDGGGGTININAQTLQVKGVGMNVRSSLFDDTAISTSTFGKANAGNININVGNMSMEEGSYVTSVSHTSGKAGNIAINATNSLQIVGNNINLTLIGSSVAPNPNFQKIFNLPDVPSGDAGNIIINTPSLLIKDGAFASVDNLGTGNGGTLKVNANLVKLENLGYLSATTKTGEGGNISLKTQNLLLRRESAIGTSAGGRGNGGNISIDTPVIIGLENSDIIANAVKGNGGNIDITTQGIFGLKYQNQLTPNSDITASSEFGINGKVDINNFGVDPNSGLIELPANVTDSSQQIATGCSANQGSSFVATGRGGIPQNPNQEANSNSTWSDIRDISKYRSQQQLQAQIPQSPKTLVQATGMRRNTNGKVELIADKTVTQTQQPLTCVAVPKS
jgi:filamentous hemagglutinin family protein